MFEFVTHGLIIIVLAFILYALMAVYSLARVFFEKNKETKTCTEIVISFC